VAITLADAQQNCADDVDYAVIDEFRKNDFLLDSLTFDDAVVPGVGGATLSYGYTRLVTERAAQTRDYNAEVDYTPKATRTKVSVDLVPFGAGFTVDRVLGNLGPAATNEVNFQMAQAIKSTRAKVADSIIDGASNSDSSFEGLDAILTGSSTEVNGGVPGTDVLTVTDWRASAITTAAAAHTAIDALDNLLSLLDGEPGAILTNRQGRLRLRSIARVAGYLTQTEDKFGAQIDSYAGIPIVDLGARSASSNPIIPISTKDVDGAGAGASVSGLTDFYVVRFGLDGFHGVATQGSQIVNTYLPDFSTQGAVKKGEVEMGPVAVALKATKAAAVLRNVRIS
jgi:hypothetical protein